MPDLKKTVLNWWRSFFKEPSARSARPARPLSLEDLEKAGLKIRPARPEEFNEKSLIHASQLSPHILPWTALLKSGVYCVQFSPALKSQMAGGFLSSPAGSLSARPTGLHPLAVLSPVLLYQAGVMVFGAWHLKKISESLGNLNKKLDDVHNFQWDRRSSKIKAHFQEFLHLSEGIVEFKEKGNIREIQNRLKSIRYIRLINGAHLLHLKKNLTDRRMKLGRLTGSSVVFKSGKELSELMSSVESYGKNLMDYKLSLFLDIICVNVEVVFSVARSLRETESRLKAEEGHIRLFREETGLFETALFDKIPKLVKKGLFEREEGLNERKRKVESAWKNLKNEIICDFDHECGKHIKSTREALKRPSVVFLEVKNEQSVLKK